LEQLEFPFEGDWYREDWEWNPEDYWEGVIDEFEYYVRSPEDLDLWLEDHELTPEHSG